jgi:hypothetical protein
VREGAGLAFFYYVPTSSLVGVPVGSIDAPFIFQEVTADFQEVTVQGQATVRVRDPKRMASLLNFTLTPDARAYVSDDPQKLTQRVVNAIQVLTRAELRSLSLREALKASDRLVLAVRQGLEERPEIQALGLEVLGLALLAIKPNPETARALEAETRENLLKQADDATYARRNSAVEQERAIRENELNTEIAVENKKRQIREAQMEAEKAVQEKQHALAAAEMVARTALEQQRKELVSQAAENARLEADAKAYGVSALMKALAGVEPRVLQSLAAAGMDSRQLIALAFDELAQRAEKIGELNISPDLLGQLLERRGAGKDAASH